MVRWYSLRRLMKDSRIVFRVQLLQGTVRYPDFTRLLDHNLAARMGMV